LMIMLCLWSVQISNTLWDKTVLISFSFALVRRISAFVSSSSGFHEIEYIWLEFQFPRSHSFLVGFIY
jgi:hypothetical protein